MRATVAAADCEHTPGQGAGSRPRGVRAVCFAAGVGNGRVARKTPNAAMTTPAIFNAVSPSPSTK